MSVNYDHLLNTQNNNNLILLVFLQLCGRDYKSFKSYALSTCFVSLFVLHFIWSSWKVAKDYNKCRIFPPSTSLPCTSIYKLLNKLHKHRLNHGPTSNYLILT